MSEPCRLQFHGLEALADVSGALYLTGYKALLVADLHFEKGSARAARGVHLPPFDTRSTLAALTAAIERFRPERLIALGDSFHDDGAGARLADDDRCAIIQLGERCDVFWLTGNHDPQAADGIGGRVLDEMALGPLTLRHIPRAGAVGEIAGHLHPAACVSRRGRRLRRKCFVADANRMILPAFGAYTGGLDICDTAFAGLLEPATTDVWMIGRDKVHKVRRSLVVRQSP